MRNMKSCKELQRYVQELCDYARQLFPDAEICVKPPYETEDADIIVKLPKSWRGSITRQRDALIQRKLDILLDTGYDIVVFIEKPNRKRQAAEERK